MRKYEIMYIIRPTVEAEARKALIEEMNKILTDQGAADIAVNEWGMRELAYEIDDCKKGYYVVLSLNAEPAATMEADRVMKIKEDVLRHIIISREEK
ncbi:MAG TPA: 30S ribosomal protein S6 [Bacillota bacterium]|nr:30S ribosomal protein S6 [Bacillota bacterium]HPF42680.1 30S ribosomal protein S6 [Bacillota bacterium]HPJ86304.1 30S ribosomal protein S6 [Bacillota bacterium]HPQ62210.1 30S ribosomal protein S6 [Bacillota bacterium]HRX91921.1 30S ribosomal protein S6 [Candidatus Izemoplasmatales bacterium]